MAEGADLMCSDYPALRGRSVKRVLSATTAVIFAFSQAFMSPSRWSSSEISCRVHEFIAGLQSSYAQPNGADFDRLVKMLDATARQPLPDDTGNKMQVFLQAFHGIVKQKAQQPEFAHDERLQALRTGSTTEPVIAGDAGKSACT